MGLPRVTLVAALGLIVLGTSSQAENGATTVRFDRAQLGALPPGWRALSTSDEEPGRWQVEQVGKRLVLSQIDLGRHGYRLAVPEGPALADVHVGTRLRMGRGDRAAGLAWRIRDARNYYAARLDFDSREVVVYKFVHGSRVRLDRKADVRLDPDAWHELLVEHAGDKIRVWLNGVPVASDRDDSLREAGAVGFWMPGDGTAHFERLWYRPLPTGS